jgi:hypothetical protein
MKLKCFLGLSICLNIALAVLFLLGVRTSPISSLSLPSTHASNAGSDSNPDSIPQVERATKPFAAQTQSVNWVQALRNAGLSEKVIANVAAADFEERWQKRAQDNQRKVERGEIDENAVARFDLEHDAQQEKDLRAVLGDEGFRRWDQTRVLADFDRDGVEMTATESNEAYDIRKKLDRKRLELDKVRQQGNATDEELGQQSATMYAEYNKELLKLLGDDRYALAQNGGDTGLSELRRNLLILNSDGAQAGGMETAQQAWNGKRGKLDIQLQTEQVTAEEYEKRMKSLDAERDQEYQKVLGAEGFAEFQKTQDPRYQTLKSAGSGWGFTDNDINNLFASIQDYEENVRDYRERAQAIETQGQAVDWSAVEKALKEYSQQTEMALRANLGDKFDKLKRSNVMPFER